MHLIPILNVWNLFRCIFICISICFQYKNLCIFRGPCSNCRHGKLYKIQRPVGRCWIQKVAGINCPSARGPMYELPVVGYVQKISPLWNILGLYTRTGARDDGRPDGTSPRESRRAGAATRRPETPLSEFYQHGRARKCMLPRSLFGRKTHTMFYGMSRVYNVICEPNSHLKASTDIR